MLRHYLILFRTFWLGSLWSGVYIARPVLEKMGYFPYHGIDVLHAIVAVGIVAGVLMLLITLLQRAFNWRQLPQQLMVILLLMSLMYFALMPWWKLQMMLLHAMSALGLVWVLLAPVTVIFSDRGARGVSGAGKARELKDAED